MKFNENLRNLRREKDLSQEALALDMNVSRQTISKWENGTAMPDLKKLTELAEYFNVSMDTLLGTAVENDGKYSDENNDDANDDLKRYVNDLLAYSEANQQTQNKKTVKALYISLAVVIVVFVFALVSLYNNLSNKINSLSQSLITVQTHNGSYDGAEDDSDCISSKVVCLGKDKPYIARVHFEYSPESYPKNAEIYFLIPQKEGEAVKDEAALENGVFTADADVDITLDKEIYLCIDDGNTVEKKTVPTYFVSDCIEITIQSSSDGNADAEYNPNNKTKIVSFQPYDAIAGNKELYIYKGTEGKFTSARLAAAHNGREEYTKELTLRERTPDDNYANYIVQIPPLSFVLPCSENIEEDQNDTLYISLTDELGAEYRYYPLLDGNSDINFGLDCQCELVFNTETGEVIVKDNAYY